MSNSLNANISQQAIEDTAKKMKALSNPHRLRIFLELAGCNKSDCTLETDADAFVNCQREFAEYLDLAPSTVSHHFKELRTAGLVTMERKGKKVLFTVDKEFGLQLLNTIEG